MRKKAMTWTEILRRTDSDSPVMETRSLFVKKYYGVLEAVIRPLVRLGVSPNFISFVSLLAALLSAYCYARNAIFTGGLLLLFTGFLDTMDGTIARLSGQSTRFGALLDSTLDRYAEFFIFFALLILFRQDWVFYVVLLALMGSVMVSYVKARSQSLGKTRSVGLMQRPERLILLILGSLINTPVRYALPEFGNVVLIATIILLAVLSNITALRRLYQGKKDLR